MSELHTDPSPNELLERMVQIESRLCRLYEQLSQRLEAEIETRKAETADLLQASKLHDQYLSDDILEIHGLLWPLLEKVMPEFTKDQARLDAIMHPRHSSEPKGKPR